MIQQLAACGHDHSKDVLQGVTCSLVQFIKQQVPGRAVAVIIDDHVPAISTLANPTSHAAMTLAMCELMAERPRPTDCANCAEAYDRVLQALAILKGVPGKC